MNDIRPDQGQKLAELYLANSKHGNYQPFPKYLNPYIQSGSLNFKWRDPRPRVKVIEDGLNLTNDSTVVELGANSGFQTLSLARSFPQHQFVAVEGVRGHAAFISACAEIEGLDNVTVITEFLTPEEALASWPNSILLDFNVAHHLGSDLQRFDVVDVESWWTSGISSWLRGTSRAKEYWFSCGFRLGGDKGHELHDITDASGFLLRILELSPFSEEDITGLWFFDAPLAQASEDAALSAKLSSMSELNAKILESEVAGNFVGEYFRRPLIRLSHKNR